MVKESVRWELTGQRVWPAASSGRRPGKFVEAHGMEMDAVKAPFRQRHHQAHRTADATNAIISHAKHQENTHTNRQSKQRNRMVLAGRGRTTPSQPPETPPPPSSAGAGRDWSELPMDALLQVFARLGPMEILLGSGLVCRSWLRAAKEPELWLTLDMATHSAVEDLDAAALRAMARVAVDRSSGRLQAFSAKYFATDGLLKHIAHGSAASLRRLSLASCGEVSNKGFTELVTASPLLEELSLELCPNVGGRGAYERAGGACPRLRSFTLRRECFRFSHNYPRRVAEALGIAAMAQLRSLTLVSSNVNNDELVAVLDGCPRLEALCLRDCYKVIADTTLRARCAGIKTLTLPGYEDS